MFGFSEILVIFILGLVVLGPKKLPGVAIQVGRWLGRARAMARQFREQLEQEVNSINLESTPTRRPGTPPPASSEVGAPAPPPEATAPPAPDSTTAHHDWAYGPPPEALAASALPATEPTPASAHETVHPETHVYAPPAPPAAAAPIDPPPPASAPREETTPAAAPPDSPAPIERGAGAPERQS
jgi:sec-independent protein translocase protein TatB